MAKRQAGGYTHGLMLETPKVLVVDDIPDIVTILAFGLAQRGYRTEGCFGGRQALSAVRAFKPEVILLNWIMPDLDGLYVLDALKARTETARIKVLMTSAMARPARFRDAGADGFLPKPFSFIDADAAIRHVLGPSPAEFVVAGMGYGTVALGAR